MNITFENFGNFSYTLNYADGGCYDAELENLLGFKDVCDFVEHRMNHDEDIVSSYIYSAETGEIVATITREDDEDENDPEWDDWGYNEDMGFDPYMGCYTDDC